MTEKRCADALGRDAALQDGPDNILSSGEIPEVPEDGGPIGVWPGAIWAPAA
jgi:hypothetical protein